MIHHLGLIAAAVIVLGMAAIVYMLVKTFRELLVSHHADLNALHMRFLRGLEARSRDEANATHAAFAAIVLDEIGKHMGAVRDLYDKADDKRRASK